MSDWSQPLKEDKPTSGGGGGGHHAPAPIDVNQNAGGSILDTAVNAFHAGSKPVLGALKYVGDITEIPFELTNAQQMDAQKYPGMNIIDVLKHPDSAQYKLLQHYKKHSPESFAKANEMYGLNRNSDAVLAKGGDPIAQARMNHPRIAAVTDTAMEFLNPGGSILGGVGSGAGKLATKGVRIVEDAADAKGLLHYVPTNDKYRAIRRTGGDHAVEAIKATERGIKQADEAAHAKALEVFGGKGITPEHKIEILRLQQGLAPRLVGAAAQVSGKSLAERAALYNKYIKEMDAAQTSTHPNLLTAAKTEEDFTPMAGAYEDKTMSKRARGILDRAGVKKNVPSGAGGNAIRPGTAAPSSPGKVFKTWDEAEAAAQAGKVKIREDFDPATWFQKHLSQRGANVEIERGIQNNPLRNDMHYHDLTGNYLGVGEAGAIEMEKEAAKGARTIALREAAKQVGVHPGDVLTGNITKAQRVAYDKAFKEIQSRVQNSLEEQGHMRALEHAQKTSGNDALVLGRDYNKLNSPTLKHSAIDPEYLAHLERESSSRAKAPNPWGQAADRLNAVQRAIFIANPTVHLVGNVRRNAFALARKHGVTGGFVKNIPKGFTDKNLNESARAAGAHAEFGAPGSILGGDATHLMTSTGGNIVERLDRLGTKAMNWNNKVTFGTEGKIGNALFAALTERGMTETQAATEIRKALGDYTNVSKSGPEGIMNKLLYFYPWLKGNTTFWGKMLLEHPNEVVAPHKGIAHYNQSQGAPSDANSQGHEMRIYTGRDNHGAPKYFTPADPSRILGQLSGFTSGKPSDAIKSAQNIVESHATPMLGAGLDLAGTMYASAADPNNPNSFHTVFDKSAPGNVQAMQAGKEIAKRFIPFGQQAISLSENLHKSQKHGIHAPDANAIAAAAGFGFDSTQMTKSQKHHLNSARAWWTHVSKGKSPDTKARLYKTYERKVQNILDNR